MRAEFKKQFRDEMLISEEFIYSWPTAMKFRVSRLDTRRIARIKAAGDKKSGSNRLMFSPKLPKILMYCFLAVVTENKQTSKGGRLYEDEEKI